VSTVFDNLQDMTIDELVEEFGVTREQVQAVLDFAAHSAEVSITYAPCPEECSFCLTTERRVRSRDT
jgi:DNA-binding transcriptional regulator LsrR (DeoR family)